MTSVTVERDAPVTPAPSARSTVVPRPAEGVDIAFVAVLTLLALTGLRNAYGGTGYLVAGATGVAGGAGVAYAATRTRQPAIVSGVLAALAAFALSGLALRHKAFGGVLPSPASVRAMLDMLVSGWKHLLTTLHPVGATGDLLALPYLLGFAGGYAGLAVALRVRRSLPPLLAPVAVAVVCVLVGGPSPGAAVAGGAALAAAALGWVAARGVPERTSVVRQRRVFRPVAAIAMLAVAGSVAAVAGPRLPLVNDRRVVLHATAPFDLSAFPSPLAGFRRYTKAAGALSLTDRTLFTVRGAPGGPLRLATLDGYDGLVWGVSETRAPGSGDVPGFVRVGESLPTNAAGEAGEVTVTIAEGYADVWVPLNGTPHRVSFDGPRAERLRESLRYNLGTTTALAPSGLAPGDVVRLMTRPAPSMTREELATAEPHGAPSLVPSVYEFTSAAATKLGSPETAPMRRVLRIAEALRDGAYSNGLDAVPSDPGHGTGRIATFLEGKQFVGDDEQYASAMALMANAVGVPARVVIVAAPEPDGVVKGADVEVDVEVALAGRGWVPLGTRTFTPPRTKKPDPQPKQVLPRVPPRIVPPPLRRLPAESAPQDTTPPARGGEEDGGDSSGLVGILTTALRWGAPPAAVLGGPAALILGAKALRRRRRRDRGTPVTRVAMGWVEMLDAARDAGHDIDVRATRREQARVLGAPPVESLARAADAVLFAPGEVTDSDATRYWSAVDSARRSLTADLGRLQRLRAALSLRSFVPATQARAATTGEAAA